MSYNERNNFIKKMNKFTKKELIEILMDEEAVINQLTRKLNKKEQF